MKPEEIIKVLKESANVVFRQDGDGSWVGHGSISSCPECREMDEYEYMYGHYPAKKAALESLPWTKTVADPRNPEPEEYPAEDGRYLVMLDCDEHQVLTNVYRNGHWALYDRTHVKWWMPFSALEESLQK